MPICTAVCMSVCILAFVCPSVFLYINVFRQSGMVSFFSFDNTLFHFLWFISFTRLLSFLCMHNVYWVNPLMKRGCEIYNLFIMMIMYRNYIAFDLVNTNQRAHTPVIQSWLSKHTAGNQTKKVSWEKGLWTNTRSGGKEDGSRQRWMQ